MCTSIIKNGNKTIVGFNLDLLSMKYRVNYNKTYVFIEILDDKIGWLPLFGVNNIGNFVTMPTCHPFDPRSNRRDNNQINILEADIDLLLKRRSFEEIIELVKSNKICSIDNTTFQVQISNKNGDVLIYTPGQGYKVLRKPTYSVLTNFSLFKENRDEHPWSGVNRYDKAIKMLEELNDDFTVKDMFNVLKETSQEICPTVVSIVYDTNENIVYWCIDRCYDNINIQKLEE